MQENMDNIYESKDKQVVPYLLIQSNIKFVGKYADGKTIYFKFSPLKKCEELINKFISRQADPVQPKDLLDAVETFRELVFEIKNNQ